ncbi:MAG: qorA [Rickettsiaceae bacterium]|jgi:NADPH2:quinone reductase|nr:qorA [Rickettsiaceae bacterium]
MVKTQKAYIIDSSGAVDKLKLIDIAIPKLGPQEVLIKHSFIGFNFIDIEYRKGLIKGLPEKFIPGIEAVGTVVEVGSQVKEFRKGARVAYGTARGGAYAEYNVVKQEHVIPIPNSITDQAAAAFLTKGMTAHLLLRRIFFLRSENKILIHAAASGVGHLLLLLAKHYDAEVIATVGSSEKAEFIRKLGASLIINYNQIPEFSQQVLSLTKNNGVNAVFDSIGASTFDESLKSLAPYGLMVCFGRASGPAPRLDINKLSSKSLFVTSPKLAHYKNNRLELILSAMEVFGLIDKKIWPSEPQKIYDFDQIAQAHLDHENRKNVGCSIIKI